MYTELHARSAFSFLEGSATPEELAAVCAANGMGAMALLDRDGVYGSPRFHLAAKKLSLQAHIGAEVTSPEGWRYTLLVESQPGYQNLCRLITRMKLRAKKGEGHVLPEEIAASSPGLICLTGGDEGPLAHALAHGGIEAATAVVSQLCEHFGRGNVYVELQRHFCREEEARNQAALEIARKLHLPLLATNGVCYAQPPQREILDVFTCIRHHRTLATAGKLLARNSERHLKSPVEMARLFSDLPEAIANTQLLSSRLKFRLNDLGYQFPKYPTPQGESQIHFLRERTHGGMIWRYGPENERARLQIERELAMIERLDLAGYFLIVWDIVRFCREQNILVQGRGSAANSAVCYALGITAVDPVGMDLLFERFLSEERGEWPDIDLDLPSGDQRERAIQYVYQRYGQLGAAMTANVITYRGRSAAREVGKALSFDPETLNRLTSLVGAWEYKDASDTLARQFRDAGLDFQHLQIRKFLELCLAVQDLPRHLGQHSGGMVISQGQLDSVVPLEPATMPGRVVVQWDKEDCADMGIVKVDLLGLGMMAVLEDSLQIIRDDYGEQIDLGRLPAGDPLVYKTLQKADTVGMFQIESRAQMAFLPRMHPTCFYDIVVQVGIIRPGPIVGKMVHPYLKRRQGREAPDSLHPSLDPVLARTLGVPLFQEQLLRMAMIAAGFTGGEAEELRRAFGFKRSEARMKDIEKKLRAGMNKQGIAPAIQDKIVLSITSFALYGFPESHAASFALIAYASAYLKCHYLPAFTAAILNNQPMGFYNPATLVKDAQRHGLKVKPIDIAASNWKCTLERIEAVESPRRFDPSLTSPISNVASQSEPGVIPNGVRDLHLPFLHRSSGQDCGRPETPHSQGEISFGRHSERSEERFSIARLSSDESLLIDTPAVNASEISVGHVSPATSSDSKGFVGRGFSRDINPASTEGLQPLKLPNNFSLRLGLNFVKGLRAEIASEIIRERATRPFTSIDDLKFRLPAIQKSELTALAEIGALNSISGQHGHRRSALWQVERAARPAGPLLESKHHHRIPEPTPSPCHPERSEGSALASPSLPSLPSLPSPSSPFVVIPNERSEEESLLARQFEQHPCNPPRLLGGRSFSSDIPPGMSKGASAPEESFPPVQETSPQPKEAPLPSDSPLIPMTPEERLLADFRGTGLTVGLHPMAHHRATLKRQGVRSAIELRALPDGAPVRIAGSVIARQRPGTAKGFVFLSIEDETGIANAIITPQLFTRNRVVVVNQQFLLIDGTLQNQDNVISVKAHRIQPLTLTRAAAPSHDFH